MATRIFEPSDSWKHHNAMSGGGGSKSVSYISHPNGFMPMITVAEGLGLHNLYTTTTDIIDQILTMKRLMHAIDIPRIVRITIRTLQVVIATLFRARLFAHKGSAEGASLEEGHTHAPPTVIGRIRDHSPETAAAHLAHAHAPSLVGIHEDVLGLSRVYHLAAARQKSSLGNRYTDSEASTPAQRHSPPLPQTRNGTKSTTRVNGASVNTGKRQPQPSSHLNPYHPALLSRSPSHSSIASSRETSVKPTERSADIGDTSGAPVAVDVKQSHSPVEPANQCPPQTDGTAILPQDLKVAGPCPATEAPSIAVKEEKPSERDFIEEVEMQDVMPEKASDSADDIPAAQVTLPQAQDTSADDSDNDIEIIENGTSLQNAVDTGSIGAERGDSPNIVTPPSQGATKIVPDFGPEDIPNMADATTVREALRVVVMTRLLADRQTRAERVEPILATNLQLPRYPHEKVTSERPTPEVLIKEMMHPAGPRAQTRDEMYRFMHDSLVEKFEARQTALKDKVQRLREEYLSLHEKWVDHCARLDEQARSKQGGNASETPILPSVLPPATGRTTRRSAATMGDAVRSDFEMEQIIASIGYDEATDPNQLCVRNLAVIPDMISVTRGQVDYVFDDNNLRVDNPAEYYAPDTGIHDWTEEEKQVFLDKFAAQPKQFGAIAKALPNKTAAQCVDFYYLHKKVNIDFRNVVAMNAPGKKGKRRTGKRKGNSLMADIRKHDAEVGPSTRGKGKRTAAATVASLKSREGRKVTEDTPTTATPTPEPESRPRRRRAAASAISSKPSSSLAIVTNDPEEEGTEDPESISRPTKRAKRTRKVKSAAIVDDGSEGEGKSAEPEPSNRRRNIAVWSDDDKELFVKLLGQHGDNFKRISASMPNKTQAQVHNFYRNNIDKLGLREIAKNAPRTSPEPSQPRESPPMASLPLDGEDSAARDVQSAATSVSATPVPTDPTAGQTVPIPRRDLSTMLPYNSYTTPYGASTTVPMSVYSAASKGYTSGYGAVAYGSYGPSAPPGVYPNGAYASTRSAYYPYPYSYTVPAGPYGSATTNGTPPVASPTTAPPNPYTDPRYYPYPPSS
ncbi:DNA-binding protein snt1 [Marasmius tenuissimus]|uniref:DNA-binding protein snt1 n=1 Tax=Marasmius tenuissimus TaxID=585030 RepID=A0ABR3A3B7_9AGAR